MTPSPDPVRPSWPPRRYWLLLFAAGMGTCGLGVVLAPGNGAPGLATPAHAEDRHPALTAMAAKPASGDPTSAALEGALAAAAARTDDAVERVRPSAPPGMTRDEDGILRTPPPDEWLTGRRRGRCHRYAGRGFCDGPLKVAKPHGEAAERAEELGLGTFKAAAHLLGKPPLPEWVEAVEGEKQVSLRWPVDGGNLWRGYGWTRRRTGRRHLHKGVDIGADPGTPVVAVNDAIVAYSKNEVRGYGNLLLLIHADGTVSLYAHLKAAYVFPGQQMKRGQVVGEVGYTGLARGPHLHFEWRRRAYPRNPIRHFVDVPEDQVSRLPEHALARR